MTRGDDLLPTPMALSPRGVGARTIRPSGLLLGGLLALFPGPGLRADRAVLVPVADTTLDETWPENNLGAVTNFVSGTSVDGLFSRALIKFDVAASLPSNALIQNATVQLTATLGDVLQPDSYRLHRMLQDWNEGVGDGDGGAQADLGEVTWFDQLYPDVPWSLPGAAAPMDYVLAPSATQLIDLEGDYSFSSAGGLVADAQDWLNDAKANFGWILVCENEASPQTARSFASREDRSRAPRLIIDYTIQPNIALHPVADTSLFEMHPDNNLGASSLVSGTIGTHKRSRALLKFDLASAVPAHAVITYARLALTVAIVPAGVPANTHFDLHRLLRDWGEGEKAGTLGTAANDGESTWNAGFFPDTLWNTPGAAAPEDYSEKVSAKQFISRLGRYDFSGLVEDTQFWLANPDLNFGWILVCEDEVTVRTARRFASREDPLRTPTLVLAYLLPAHIERSMISGPRFHMQFRAEAGQSYSVERSSALATTEWIAVTNVSPPAISQTVDVFDAVGRGSSFYRVRTQ